MAHEVFHRIQTQSHKFSTLRRNLSFGNMDDCNSDETLLKLRELPQDDIAWGYFRVRKSLADRYLK